MATIYFTNNADSGDGSLREAWSNASSGDVIMPDPSSFSGDTIEILLGGNWSFKTFDLTLDGGDYRIILNGQDAYRFGTGSSASIVQTYRNVDFKNFSYTGTGSTAVQYPLYLSGLGSLTYTNCRFYGNHCASGATSNFMRTTSLSSASIILNNCLAYGNGRSATSRFIQSGVGSFTINGCTLVSGINGTVTNNDSILSSDSDYANAGFVDAANNDFRLTPSSPYLTGGTLTGTDYLGHTRNGSKGAFDGSWLVVGSSGSTTVSANTSVDYAELLGTVTFSGTDRILAVTKGATIGSATLSAATSSNGYLAVPSGTTTSSATLSGVKIATYGAGISNASISTTSDTTATLTWSQSVSGVPVLLELQSGGSWTTVKTNASSPESLTYTPIGGKTFRLFDGIQFLTVQTEVPAYEYAIQYQVVSVVVGASDEEEHWEAVATVIGVDDMSDKIKPGQAVTILARIYDAFDNDSPLVNDGTNIESVTYSCEKKTKGLYQFDYTPVTGHTDVEADTDCVLTAVETSDAWEVDETGYNFVLSPDITENLLFADTGEYRFRVTVNLEEGNPITFYHTVQVEN